MFVIEGADHVAIGLVRREVHGQGPDGMMYGVSLNMGGWASLDVVLSRSVLDAATGERVPRVERLSDAPPPGEGVPTPLWRWS